MNRFYFYNTRGGELKDHPLHGTVFEGCGAGLAIKDNDKWQFKKTQTVKGELISRTELHYFTSLKNYSREQITINDFKGHDKILVKLWSVEENEWFILEAKKENEEHACNVPMFGGDN
jgi:hypothetical protein